MITCRPVGIRGLRRSDIRASQADFLPVRYRATLGTEEEHAVPLHGISGEVVF